MARNGLTKARKAPVLAVAFLIAAALVPALQPAAFAQEAQRTLRVANHVFTTRVIRTADGSFLAQDILVGFERGTATFQTLTQVVLARGSHRISLAIVDPGGSEISRVNFPVIEAQTNDWTQTLEGTWRNIRFSQSGEHAMVVYLANQEVTRFHFVVK